MPPPSMASSAVDVQYADDCEVDTSSLPGAPLLRRWVRSALMFEGASGSISIRIMGDDEMTSLNDDFRGKTGATNVLSFPAGESPGNVGFLGDIAICAPVVVREALAQGKPCEAHFAHLVIHGVLHLLGYDHESEAEALVMEGKEVQILARLGVDDPYAAERRDHG